MPRKPAGDLPDARRALRSRRMKVSKRGEYALRALIDLGIVDGDEIYYVRKVLNAAALTYVAATLQSILTLLYYLVRLGLFSSRNDD